ncbi:MAG: cell division protein FtsA [Candidatus Handelsmanbacteria bacterium]|nr:cell division protein FtsA [Candidatus Handelsmanbacteria bacterium]
MGQDEVVVGLDIGTTKVCAIIAQLTPEGEPKVVGVGVSPSEGVRRGVVVDMDKTVQAVQKAVQEAELMAGLKVEAVYLGIAGEHLASFNSRGVIAVGGDQHEIEAGDKARVIEAARAVAIPFDRQVLHVLPQEYSVDDQDGIRDPVGMCSIRLETTVHIATAAATAIQNLTRGVERAGLKARGIYLESLASSRAVLEEEELEMGVCLVDLGGGTTSLAVFYQGSVRHSAVIGLGGQSLTSDIAICLRTSWSHAEKIKCGWGAARVYGIGQEEVVEVPGIARRQPQRVPRRELASIIEARMEEILGMVGDELSRSGCAEHLSAGVVLSGGGALLEGAAEQAELLLGLPVRLGAPRELQGMSERLAGPAYATAAGLVLMGAQELEYEGGCGGTEEAQSSSVVGRAIEWLKKQV